MSDFQQKAAAEDHYYAALDLFSNGNHEEAIREYKAALDIDPAFTDAMHGLCRAHRDLNQLDGPANPKLRHSFRQAMLLNGVDIPGLGGWLTMAHGEDGHFHAAFRRAGALRRFGGTGAEEFTTWSNLPSPQSSSRL